MDPLSLLAHMEEAAGEGDSHALQPFQVLKKTKSMQLLVPAPLCYTLPVARADACCLHALSSIII